MPPEWGIWKIVIDFIHGGREGLEWSENLTRIVSQKNVLYVI
jgi:hypothetical protein